MGYESKQRALTRTRWISLGFSAALVLVAITWLAWTFVQISQKQAEVDQREADLKIVTEYLSLEADDIVFSDAPEQVKAILADVLDIDTARTPVEPPETVDPRWENIQVQFFPKAVDRVQVEAMLDSLKVIAVTGAGNPALSSAPTNAVWYGREVPPELVEQLSVALIDEGLKLQAIRQGSSTFAPNRIQIGSTTRLQTSDSFTADDVKNRVW